MPSIAGHRVRPIYIALNVLNSCHSSSCVELGDTRVICGVRRPQQLVQEYRGDRGRVDCEVHRVSSEGTKDDESLELDLSLALQGVAEQLVILESIPQLLVEVTLEIIHDGGALWDALSTALATALVVGGIEMRDMFSACSAALLHDGTVVVDPSLAEEESAKSMVVVCCSLSTNQIVYSKHVGAAEVSTLSQLIDVAVSGCTARKDHILSQLKGNESM